MPSADPLKMFEEQQKKRQEEEKKHRERMLTQFPQGTGLIEHKASKPSRQPMPIKSETKPEKSLKETVEAKLIDKPEKGYKDIKADFSVAAKDIDPANRAFFKDRLDRLDQWYDQEKDRMDKAELAETLAHAFTQLGAGMWGLKTGTDMSGLKFDKRDWDKKMDRLLGEFRVKQAAIEKERGEAIQAEQEQRGAEERRQDREFRKKQAEVNVQKLNKQLGMQADQLQAQAEQAQTAKEQKKLLQEAKELRQKTSKLNNILLSGDSDADTARKIKLQLGLSQGEDEIEEILEKADPWFGSFDPVKASALMAPLLSEPASEEPAKAPEESGLEQKIEIFMQKNPQFKNRKSAEEYLRSKGIIK